MCAHASDEALPRKFGKRQSSDRKFGCPLFPRVSLTKSNCWPDCQSGVAPLATGKPKEFWSLSKSTGVFCTATPLYSGSAVPQKGRGVNRLLYARWRTSIRLVSGDYLCFDQGVPQETNDAINLRTICELWPLSVTKRELVTTGWRFRHAQIGRAESVSVEAFACL